MVVYLETKFIDVQQPALTNGFWLQQWSQLYHAPSTVQVLLEWHQVLLSYPNRDMVDFLLKMVSVLVTIQ